MPRRRVLTQAQLESLLALPATEADLVRHWTLDRADLAAADRRRGGHNQFGFALQLCALRYPGRFLRPGELIPLEALHFVADNSARNQRRSPAMPPGSRPAMNNSMPYARRSASPNLACSWRLRRR